MPTIGAPNQPKPVGEYNTYRIVHSPKSKVQRSRTPQIYRCGNEKLARRTWLVILDARRA
jgi:hypothetical protein